MKITTISFLTVILLFTNCGKNSFLIKKRYSRGFYIAHSNRTKTERFDFATIKDEVQSINEFVTTSKQEKNLPIKSQRPKLLPVNISTPLKILNSNVDEHKNFDMPFKKNTTHRNNKHYNSYDLKNDLVSFGALVLTLAIIVAMVKVFALQFTVAVSLVIAFTVIAVYFLLRIHLNKNPRN